MRMLVFDYGALRTVRRALHFKQSDAAAVMKCTAATISNIENGKVKISAVDLATLAGFYQRDIDEFYVERLDYNE